MIRFSLLLLVAATLTGCQTRLNVEKTAELTPDGFVTLDVDAPRYDQQVTIDYRSTTCEISLLACLDSDKAAVEAAIYAKKLPIVPLGSAKGKAGQFSIAVPAGKKYTVFLSNATARTSVTIKIIGG